MSNLNKIYQELKKKYENIQVSDEDLRRMAWYKRDRMIYESHINNLSQPSTSTGGKNINDVSDYFDDDYIDNDYV